VRDNPPKKRSRRWFFVVSAAAAVVVGIGIGYRRSVQPNRVSRKNSGIVSEEFEYLTRRIDFDSRADFWLSRKQAEDDLDELEWLLENRYSYLKLKGVDYKAALDTIRNSLGDGINRSLFGYQLAKFISLFGDGHSRVASSSVQLRSLSSNFLPFLVEESAGRLVAFEPDRSGFVDEQYPFLRSIGRTDVNLWLEAACRTVAKGSPQFQRYHTIRNLRYVQCLRKELGLRESAAIQVELASADGSSTKQIELPLAKKPPVYGFWPRPETEIKLLEDIRVESRILKANIGYLRILVMLDEPGFLEDLVETMQHFTETDGLIIDLRTNGGGSRAPLQVLFPFFMAKEEAPRIVNVAAYRLGIENIKEDFAARYLFPASSPHWSETERAAVARFAATFQTQWIRPEGQFSQWHYFLISPINDKKYFYYDKPVVILMGRWNFSACDIFLGAFKGRKSITLMGLPSGGGSGCRQRYRLRNSRIRMHLSSMASFLSNGKLYDGNGIQPDIIIEPTPTDFIGKTDTVLNAAIRYIQGK
jgi:hypothetical protein